VKDLTLDFLYLVPIALCLGTVGLCAFIWSLNSGQYDDLDGAAERILFDDEDFPLPRRAAKPTRSARQP
jgi:cbb3-type cytochrome oxidase maturation protein